MAANRRAMVSSASSQVMRSNRASPFVPDSLHRVEQAVGAVDALEVSGHLLAEESAREGVIGIAPEFHRDAVRAP